MDKQQADELLIRIDERTEQIKSAVDKLDHRFTSQVAACHGLYVYKTEFQDIKDAYNTARKTLIGTIITAILSVVGLFVANKLGG